MPHNEARRKRQWSVMGRRVAGLVLLACLLPAAALAQGPIVLDGAGDDWDASWQVAGDPLDVFLTDLQTHPHEAPTHARSGYDATALWAHYQAVDHQPGPGRVEQPGRLRGLAVAQARAVVNPVREKNH